MNTNRNLRTAYFASTTSAHNPPDIRKQKIKLLPVSIKTKRKLLNKSPTEKDSVAQHVLELEVKSPSITEFCGLLGITSEKIKMWESTLKAMEGMQGFLVAAYFEFLRTLFLFNVVIFLFIVMLLVIPQIIFSVINNYNMTLMLNKSCSTSVKCSLIQYCSKNYESRIKSETNLFNNAMKSGIGSSFFDAFSGSGFMENAFIFIGNYYPFKSSLNFIYYSMPATYLITMLLFYFFSFLLLLKLTGHSVKQSLTTQRRNYDEKFTMIVFTTWNFSLTDKSAHKTQNILFINKIRAEFEDMKFIEKSRSMRPIERYRLWLMRVLLNASILGLIIIGAFLIYWSQTLSVEHNEKTMKEHNERIMKELNVSNSEGKYRGRQKRDSHELIYEYLPSITITFLGVVYPQIFKGVVKWEQYRADFTQGITLYRTIIVRLASIIFFWFTSYSVISCKERNPCRVPAGSCPRIDCWGTYLGKQFYKLSITFLIASIGIFIVHDVLYSLMRKHVSVVRRFFGPPTMDVIKGFLDVIYLQVLCWCGTYFCPVLPTMTALSMLLTFVLNRTACLYFYQPSGVPIRAVNVRAAIMVSFFITFFICFIQLLYVFLYVQTSLSCGPFRIFQKSLDAVVSADFSKQWSSLTTIIIIAILILLCYYYYVMNSANRIIKHRYMNSYRTLTLERRRLFVYFSKTRPFSYDMGNEKLLPQLLGLEKDRRKFSLYETENDLTDSFLDQYQKKQKFSPSRMIKEEKTLLLKSPKENEFTKPAKDERREKVSKQTFTSKLRTLWFEKLFPKRKSNTDDEKVSIYDTSCENSLLSETNEKTLKGQSQKTQHSEKEKTAKSRGSPERTKKRETVLFTIPVKELSPPHDKNDIVSLSDSEIPLLIIEPSLEISPSLEMSNVVVSLPNENVIEETKHKL